MELAGKCSGTGGGVSRHVSRQRKHSLPDCRVRAAIRLLVLLRMLVRCDSVRLLIGGRLALLEQRPQHARRLQVHDDSLDAREIRLMWAR